MRIRWYLRASEVPRGLLLVALCLPAMAAPRAPAWLTAAAARAVPANLPADAVAVVLEDDQTVTVAAGGQTETLRRVAVKILRPEAHDEYGSVTIPFDNETKVKSLAAWTILPGGAVLATRKQDIVETGFSPEALYSDDRQDSLTFPAADPGDIVGYAYVRLGRPYLHEQSWDVQRDVPVLAGRFALQLPADWKMNFAWAGRQGPAPTTAGGEYEWRVANVPELAPQETHMPAWAAVSERLLIRYYPAGAGDADESWAALGAWYETLTRGRQQTTPAIDQEVASLTAGAATPLDKIRALAKFVQSQVRYVAIEIGIGGYMPHSAGDVFAGRYGDCKDKATLLSAMLGKIGVESYYVIINAERGVTRPDFPSLSFDHVILAIRLPAGTPTDDLYAVVTDPKLGPLLFFDPTDPYCPLGYLPGPLQENYGLVVAPGGSELVELPLLPGMANRLLRVGDYTLDAAGNLSGKTQDVRWGAPAEAQRATILATAPKDRAKLFEDFLDGVFDRVQLTNAQIGNLQLYGQNLVETYGFVAPGYAVASGGMLIVRPCVINRTWPLQQAGKKRQYPLAFPATMLQTEKFEIHLPAGSTVRWLPAPAQVEDEFMKYSSRVEFAGGVLSCTRSYERKQVLAPTAGLGQLRRDFAAIGTDQSRAVTVMPPPVALSGTQH